MKSLTLFAGLVSLLVTSAAAAQQSAPELETVKLTDHVYVVVGAGGNVGVSVGEDGVFIIDDKVKAVTEALRAALDTITDDDVRFVFNTHWHGDHTGGNEHFGKAGAVIVAQKNVRKRMSAEQFMETMEQQESASPEAALPIITFVESLTFHLNDDTIRVTHVPHGHTDGDSLVYFEGANVLHMGDTYFASGYPYIDLSSGGSIEGLIAAVATGLEIADAETQLIPGHGSMGTEQTLTEYHQMMSTITDRVRGMMESGKSLEAIQSAGVTEEFDERWDGGFIDSASFVKTVYTSLSEE